MPVRKKRASLKVLPRNVKEEQTETEVRETPVRRTFTAAYKEKILKDIDAAPIGTVASILRREGLYASMVRK